MANAIPFILVCFTFSLSGLIWAYFLTLGAKWAKVEGVTLSRALFISLICHAAAASWSFAEIFGIFDYEAHPVLYALLIAGLALELFFIKWAIRSTLWQAFKSWLPTLLNAVVQALIALLIVRPFIFEAFTIPTNSMAPMILGVHYQAKCPTCNATAYASPIEYQNNRNRNRPPAFICENYHIIQKNLKNLEAGIADRIVVNKLIAPQRWDAVVFRFPGDRGENYIKRLVGLPGETIQIKEGGVWIEGERLTPPDSLAGITYVNEIYGRPVDHGAQPITLANDEYFMLGDFTIRALDSRLWTTSQIRPAAPYAVLKSEIIGVATHTYGHRWKSLEP